MEEGVKAMIQRGRLGGGGLRLGGGTGGFACHISRLDAESPHPIEEILRALADLASKPCFAEALLFWRERFAGALDGDHLQRGGMDERDLGAGLLPAAAEDDLDAGPCVVA